MRTRSKILVISFLWFALGASGLVIHQFFDSRRHVADRAFALSQVIIDRTHAVHTYFTKELKPSILGLMESGSEPHFNPVWMSSTYANRKIDELFRAMGNDNYSFKSAAVNDRSPESEADDLEIFVLEKMNLDPEMSRWKDIIRIGGKPYSVLMVRNDLFTNDCLRCHGNPGDAPQGLVEFYGAEHGFYKTVGHVSSVFSVRMPLSADYHHINLEMIRTIGILTGALFITLFCVRWITNRTLIKPIRLLREEAHNLLTPIPDVLCTLHNVYNQPLN